MAVLVDGVVSLLLAIPGVIVAIGPVFNGSEEPDPLGIVLIGLAMILLTIVQAVLISKRGQSIGKIALGIRIAHSVDGSNPGFWWRRLGAAGASSPTMVDGTWVSCYVRSRNPSTIQL